MGKLIIRIVLLIISILNSQQYIFSQSNQINFRHISSDAGLTSSKILCLYQDYQGFLWIGTYGGLNRYDGVSFINYKHNSSDSNSIASNVVLSIYETSKKKLFMGTLVGLSMYDREKDNFVNYSYEKSSPFKNSTFYISCIIEDESGNLWLGTNIGLVNYDIQSNKIFRYSCDDDKSDKTEIHPIENLLIDSKGRFWVTTRNGLKIFDRETKSFKDINVTISGKDISEYYFTDIIEDVNGNVWIASLDGLFCCENSDDNFISVRQFKNNPDDKCSLSGNRVRSLCLDKNNRLWIGTESGGLNLYDEENECFLYYQENKYDPYSINNESIQTILVDKTGNLWVGTFNGGLNVAPVSEEAIITYRKMPAVPTALNHNAILCFLEDSKGRVWIGTDGGGINIFDKNTHQFSHYTVDNSNIAGNTILSLYEDHEGYIWIGTWTNGLVRFDPKSKQFRTYNKDNSSIPDNNIYAIAGDDDHNIWLGTFENGLVLFEKSENEFISYNVQNSVAKSNMVVSIKIDSQGIMYLGCPDQFVIFDPDNEKLTSYHHEPNDTNSISNSSITDIYIDNDTSVWISTVNGLNIFNPLKNKFIHINKEDGLPGNGISGIVKDFQNKFWISTSVGICRFDREKNEFITYTRDDGLQGNEFNFHSILRSSDGKIFAGGTNGFSIITPGKVVINKSIPEILITDLEIFNKPVKINGSKSPLKKQICMLDEIVLSHKQSVLTFHFASMDFTVPRKNKYKYMMKNFDKDWIDAGNKTEATYTNLDPGEYTFCVIGSNNDGVWNYQGTQLKVIILPPWYDTWFFRIAAILLVTGLSVSFYRYRVKALKKQKMYLEHVVEERTFEIKQKNKILSDQAEELNQTNVLLEERQQRIEEQNEVLLLRSDELNETNSLLEERQQYIEEQAEELKVTADELNEKNTELNVLNATKDRFFSIIAHDLKNPFNSIMGFSEILLARYDKYDDGKRRHFIKGIYDSSVMVYRLLENLLQWSGSQTNTIQFEPTDIVLKDLVDTNIHLIKNQADEKNNKITNRIPKDIMVRADRNMINTVLRNLVTNANKFTEEGKIDIRATQDKKEVRIEISDTGIGMDKEKCKKLFQIEKAKSTQGTKGERGTGLGLILCKEFITRHRGSIGVTSTEGKGSVFWFTLPNPLN